MKHRALGCGLLVGLAVLGTVAKAGPRTQTKQSVCTQFVHYDKSNLSITLPTIRQVSLGSLNKKSEKIQAAADLTQLFDLIQFANCQTLDKLAAQADQKEYANAARATMAANNQLLALAIAFSAYSKDEKHADKVAETALSSLTTAKSLQSESTQGEIKSVNLDKLAANFQGDLSSELARLRKAEPLPREKLWALISDDNKKAIRDQLKRALDALRNDNQLHLGEDDLAAFVLMPGGDGQLYFPPGMLLRPEADQSVPGFSIPKGYGAAGVAFEENEKEFVEIGDTTLRLGSSPEAKESQRKIRMIAIPKMGEVHARYVAAFPIDNYEGQPIAVMTISVYKLFERSDDLREACKRIPFSSIQQRIADLLTLKE